MVWPSFISITSASLSRPINNIEQGTMKRKTELEIEQQGQFTSKILISKTRALI